MALAYASLLPEQSFLLVATRRSGTQFDRAPNVTCASLAAYAGGPEPKAEYLELLGKWRNLQPNLKRLAGDRPAVPRGSAGRLPEPFPRWTCHPECVARMCSLRSESRL